MQHNIFTSLILKTNFIPRKHYAFITIQKYRMLVTPVTKASVYVLSIQSCWISGFVTLPKKFHFRLVFIMNFTMRKH